MICVVLAAAGHDALIEGARQAARGGAHLVEVRLDAAPKDLDLKRLFSALRLPAIATCRASANGGMGAVADHSRLARLDEAASSGAAWVDVEVEAAAMLPRRPHCKRLVSHHDHHDTPEDLGAVLATLSACDADALKLVTTARRFDDNAAVLGLAGSCPLPLITFAMGPLGALSRLLGRRRGSPFTYAALSAAARVAPGQPTLAELTDVYGYERIGNKTEIIVSTKSYDPSTPAALNHLFKGMGVDRVCLALPAALDLSPQTLLSALDRLGITAAVGGLAHAGEPTRAGVAPQGAGEALVGPGEAPQGAGEALLARHPEGWRSLDVATAGGCPQVRWFEALTGLRAPEALQREAASLAARYASPRG